MWLQLNTIKCSFNENKNSSVSDTASHLPSKHRWITSTNSEIHRFVCTLVYHLALKFGHSCQEVEADNSQHLPKTLVSTFGNILDLYPRIKLYWYQNEWNDVNKTNLLILHLRITHTIIIVIVSVTSGQKTKKTKGCK